MSSILAEFKLTPRDAIDNVLAGFDVTGRTALTPVPIFEGNDLARTGVALIYQEVLENIGREVGVDEHTAVAVKLLSHVREMGLVRQADIIRIDGRSIGNYLSEHPEAATNYLSISSFA